MKIKFEGHPETPWEVTEQYINHAKSLVLPAPSRRDGVSRLAVFGGSPSITKHIDELRNFDGDVWGCGSAFQWGLQNGIQSTFFCIDQLRECIIYAEGAEKAILSSCCHPDLFEYMNGRDVSVWDLKSGDECNHWATCAGSTPHLALSMGYTEIHYFGVDSSFNGPTHAYPTMFEEDHLMVSCNGKSFRTFVGVLMQAEFLGKLMRTAPDVFINRSEGLIAEFATMPGDEIDYDITHANKRIYDSVMESQKCGS